RMLIHHLDKLNAFWLKIKVLIQYGIYLHSIQKYHECKVHWNEAKILCSQLGISFENLIPELVTIDSEKEENEVPLLVQCLTSIRQMITLLNEVENKDRFLEKFLKEIILGLGATTGQVFTLNEKTNSLHKRPTIKYGRELPPLQLYDLAQLTFHTQKYQLLHKQVENYGSRGRLTAVGFPILTQNKPVAVVTIQFEHETYNTEWIETYLEVLLQIMEQSPFQELLSDQLPTNMYLPSNQSIVSQSYYGLIGQSAAMQEVYGLLELLKGKDYPVLILGESGTGKELVSKIIHTHSTRANGPYYAINCASIPENLIESELFGHTKGAFTGADQPKDGFFTLANTGTIFLDEINQISLSMQGKMLRVLQEGEYYPVGSTKLKKTDVRIICAGKPELLTLIKDGQFREDFYYRINVIEIRLPSLRERKEDIPLLVTHFIKQLNETNQNKSIYIKGIRKQALDVLMNYDFPGNVRELKNAITFATLHLKFSGYIEVDHLPKEILLNNQNTLLKNSFQQSISEFERKLILQTLNRTNWNRTLTSKILGISRPTLLQKIKQYNLNKFQNSF
ncbi:MAG: sigma-54 dependent transcriptional regulator, partial [bacterium]|nr:sigma-54 dependent transcriptional regulator [bacterium]